MLTGHSVRAAACDLLGWVLSAVQLSQPKSLSGHMRYSGLKGRLCYNENPLPRPPVDSYSCTRSPR